MDFRRFERDLNAGRHILFVDVDPGQEVALRTVTGHHPKLVEAGEGESTPRLVVRFQDKWSRFMELAP